MISEEQKQKLLSGKDFVFCNRYRCRLSESECLNYQIDFDNTGRCNECERKRDVLFFDNVKQNKSRTFNLRKKSRLNDEDWGRVAKQRGFKSEKHMWMVMRFSMNMTLKQIAEAENISYEQIRYRLKKLDVRRFEWKFAFDFI